MLDHNIPAPAFLHCAVEAFPRHRIALPEPLIPVGNFLEIVELYGDLPSQKKLYPEVVGSQVLQIFVVLPGGIDFQRWDGP
jgi:hypothetical protein